jgi:glycosyltransferase involved in cell wall biosynthesis
MKDLAVLIPVYNNNLLLNKTLHSIDENDNNFFVLIVNDGSKEDIIVPNKYPFKFHIYNLEKNVGIARALNHGLDYLIYMNYNYIARLDAGDLNKKNRFAIQYSYLKSNKDIYILGSWVEWINESLKLIWINKCPISMKEIRRKQYYKSAFVHPSVMMRSSLFLKIGYYSENHEACEDFELWKRAQHNNIKMTNLQNVLLSKLINDTSITFENRGKNIKNRIKILCKYHNFFSIHFYLGLLKQFVLYFLPYNFIIKLKHKMSLLRLFLNL